MVGEESVSERMWGVWWLPADPSKKVPGLLHLDDREFPRLELSGFLVSVSDEEPCTIYGEVGGRAVTLFKVFATRSRPVTTVGTPTAYESMLVVLGGALVPEGAGMHVEGLDETVFGGAKLGIENLNFWDGRTQVSGGLAQASAKHSASSGQRFTFEVVIDPPKTSLYDEATISTISRYEVPAAGEYRQDTLRIAAIFGTQFSISFSTPASMNRVLDVSSRMSDLVTLGMNRDSPRLGRIRLQIDEYWFEFWSKNSAARDGGDKVLTVEDQHDSLFRLSDIDDFGDLMKRWERLVATAPYGVDSVIALWRESSTFYENKLIAVCSAIEALDRGLHEDHGLPRKPTYASRCEKLINIPDKAAIQLLVGDPARWVGAVKDARNNLAHGDLPKNRKMPVATWRSLKDVSRAILALVIASELGLSPEKQLHAVRVGAFHRVRLA